MHGINQVSREVRVGRTRLPHTPPLDIAKLPQLQVLVLVTAHVCFSVDASPRAQGLGEAATSAETPPRGSRRLQGAPHQDLTDVRSGSDFAMSFSRENDYHPKIVR